MYSPEYLIKTRGAFKNESARLGARWDQNCTVFFEFLMGSVMVKNKLYQYITKFNSINITLKNITINTGRLWRCPVLGQSEIVCAVAILDVQGDTASSLCRECSLACRRALVYRRGVLGRETRAHIVERTSGNDLQYQREPFGVIIFAGTKW